MLSRSTSLVSYNIGILNTYLTFPQILVQAVSYMAFYPSLDPIFQLVLALPCIVIVFHTCYLGGFLNLLIDLVSFVVDVR